MQYGIFNERSPVAMRLRRPPGHLFRTGLSPGKNKTKKTLDVAVQGSDSY